MVYPRGLVSVNHAWQRASLKSTQLVTGTSTNLTSTGHSNASYARALLPK